MCLEKIADRIESLQAEYDNICEHVPEFKRFTHEQFVWARLAVITRIFGLMIRGNKTDGLVAYADMLNHKKPLAQSDCDTRWTFDDNLNGFTITATRSIPRGEQVYDSYGRKCNSRFFVNYGFALEDNEVDNEAVMRFAVPPDAPNLPLKTRLASTMPNSNISRSLLGVKEFQVPATYRETSDREKKTKEMFSFLRFIHANDQELLQMQHMAQANGQDGLRMDDIDPVSTRLEAEVLRHIQRAAQDALDAFDTSLEEDDALLRANDFPDMNVRNCVLMRRGEKQVLRWYTALAERAIPLLSMAWMDLRKQANKYLSNSPRDHYITHCVATLVKRGA